MAIISRNRKNYVIDRASNLGDILVAYGFATRQQVEEAEAQHAQERQSAAGGQALDDERKDRRVGQILCSLGHTSAKRIEHATEMLSYYHRYDSSLIPVQKA